MSNWKESAASATVQAETVEAATEVQVIEDAPAATPVVIADDQFSQLIQIMDRIVANPTLDLDRVKEMMAIARELRAERAEQAYTAAFAIMQPDIPAIDKRGAILDRNDQVISTYAKWEDINDVLKPILARYGFALNFPKVEMIKEGPAVVGIALVAKLRHTSGHSDSVDYFLPIDMSGSKNGVQGIGSSTSYAKKYAAGMLLNITTRDEDDDGRAGGPRGKSDAAEDAMTTINLATTCMELLKWRDDKAEELAKQATRAEVKEVQALWSSRFQKLRAQEDSRAGTRR